MPPMQLPILSSHLVLVLQLSSIEPTRLLPIRERRQTAPSPRHRAKSRPNDPSVTRSYASLGSGPVLPPSPSVHLPFHSLVQPRSLAACSAPRLANPGVANPQATLLTIQSPVACPRPFVPHPAAHLPDTTPLVLHLCIPLRTERALAPASALDGARVLRVGIWRHGQR
ncbi:hypothetical protein AG1IA_02138 [Rhizoctonia solani AG-1 IA]|uniref:Uncharacterized protein n=1 Tax=Thanatephorus cucumeris (strain AG1-IA) TaxID=983506 RepID=L8X0J9_THACA|nr:hypothetical protein AG1IA_02138 [Rhizoctonia solani AG-1 IA]